MEIIVAQAASSRSAPPAADAKEGSLEIELVPAPYRDGHCTLRPARPWQRRDRAVAAAPSSAKIELTKVELVDSAYDVPKLAPAKPVAEMR